MRPIKFRGRRSDGTFVYGHYVNIHGDDFIRDENNRGWLVTNVAQLVGIDINGREVYEGDKIVLKNPFRDEAVEVVAMFFDNLEFAVLKEKTK